MNNSSIFFNHSFDKKRLKTLVSWVLKNFGEQEALRVIELLKETGFHHATQAGISIGLHDLTTPFQKPSLVSNCEMTMNRTHQDFSGARITASERSQRIIDTWHRASDSLRKQVVDHFKNYDPFNPVYIMALSGARGNFSQVRQLIGMRGLMADQQGKIVSFPIRSNLREGLTLTEYFISCSGARKGLVDTALRTADTGYLTRRLVDVSHHVVVKRVRCNTHRKISVRPLYSYNKILLTLKERLIGRVLAEDVLAMPSHLLPVSERRPNSCLQNLSGGKGSSLTKRISSSSKFENSLSSLAAQDVNRNNVKDQNHVPSTASVNKAKLSLILAKKDQEISAELASQIELVRQEVYIRSPLTCQFTDSVCQLCYGWSMSQGDLVPLGDAVGVIAAQSIGEPGTQLTMRTFHTGGVFSGDLLQEIRAPHAGRVSFSQAFQGLVIRTAQGRIAFLTKISGELVLTPLLKSSPFQNQTLLVSHGHSLDSRIPIPALTMLFVRQGERVEKNQLLAEFSIVTQEGNQPVKSKQTLFAELSGKVIEQRTGATYVRELEEDGIEEEEDPFKFIEPRRSGRLGFFQIIAARVGATFSYKHPIVSLKKNSNQDLLKKRSNSSVRPSLFLNQASTSYGGKLDRDKNNLLEHPQKTGFAWKKTRVKPLLRYPRRKKWSKKYLHPEFVKSNAFCLETIGEHGDLVNEKYKKIVAPDMSCFNTTVLS